MTTIPQSGRRFVRGVQIAAALLMLAFGGMAKGQGVSLFVANPAQPPNVGDAIIAAAAYKESGAYETSKTKPYMSRFGSITGRRHRRSRLPW